MMIITRPLLVLTAALVLVHGAPKKRCCQPSPDCNDPCPTAEGDIQSEQAPAADGALYSDPQQQDAGAAMLGDPNQQPQPDPNAMFSDPQQPQPDPNAMFNDQQQQQPPQGEQQLEGVMEDPIVQAVPPQPMGQQMGQPMGQQMGQLMGQQMGQPMGQPMGQQMAPPMAPPSPLGMAPPMPGAPGGECCQPDPSCANPCQAPAAPQKFAYAPYPGEITFKLMQTWTDKYLDSNTPAFKILSGNVASAVKAVLGPMTTTSNVYFREGYVPGNPTTMPKTVAHIMVNGGSDEASHLQMAVTPDGSLGDGLKVYKDSFNAY